MRWKCCLSIIIVTSQCIVTDGKARSFEEILQDIRAKNDTQPASWDQIRGKETEQSENEIIGEDASTRANSNEESITLSSEAVRENEANPGLPVYQKDAVTAMANEGMNTENENAAEPSTMTASNESGENEVGFDFQHDEVGGQNPGHEEAVKDGEKSFGGGLSWSELSGIARTDEAEDEEIVSKLKESFWTDTHQEKAEPKEKGDEDPIYSAKHGQSWSEIQTGLQNREPVDTSQPESSPGSGEESELVRSPNEENSVLKPLRAIQESSGSSFRIDDDGLMSEMNPLESFRTIDDPESVEGRPSSQFPNQSSNSTAMQENSNKIEPIEGMDFFKKGPQRNNSDNDQDNTNWVISQFVLDPTPNSDQSKEHLENAQSDQDELQNSSDKNDQNVKETVNTEKSNDEQFINKMTEQETDSNNHSDSSNSDDINPTADGEQNKNSENFQSSHQTNINETNMDLQSSHIAVNNENVTNELEYIDKLTNGSLNNKDRKGFETKLMKILSSALEKMNNKTKLTKSKLTSCGQDEVFVLNKDKMILVSTGNIAHDISGMAKFEDNLMNQIRNQENIIQTLKLRLQFKEKQETNMQKILRSFKSNEVESKRELSYTQDLLKKERGKINELNEKTIEQMKTIEKNREQLSEIKIRMMEKDKKIEDLQYKLDNNYKEKEDEFLREELKECQENLHIEKRAHQQIEVNYNNISNQIVNEISSRNATKDCSLLDRQLAQQEKEISLKSQEVQEHKLTIELLNKIILQKDDMVLGLQDQVKEFLDHDASSLKDCSEKDSLIESQYEALKNLRNLSLCQDKYTQARDTALKILQNTVYEMVDKIPSCKDEAINGLKDQVNAMEMSNRPLKEMVENLQKTVEDLKLIKKKDELADDHQNLKLAINHQARALELCQQENESQKLTKAIFEGMNLLSERGLKK